MISKLSFIPRFFQQVIASARAVQAFRAANRGLDTLSADHWVKTDFKPLAKALGVTPEAASNIHAGIIDHRLPAADLARIGVTLRVGSWLAPFIPGGERKQLQGLRRDVVRAEIKAVDEMVGIQDGLRSTLRSELGKAARSRQLSHRYIARHWTDHARQTKQQLAEVSGELEILSRSLSGKIV